VLSLFLESLAIGQQAAGPPTPGSGMPGSTGSADSPPDGSDERGRLTIPGRRLFGALSGFLPLPIPDSGDGGNLGAPGAPPAGRRPRPGGIFDPGAAGPGISQGGDQNFLDGALDRRTGWPFVLLDHFKPRPERVDAFWIVSTRDCPQEMGSDPWPKLRITHFNESGKLVEVPAEMLFAQTIGRPVLIQVQGSLTTPDIALGGLMWTHSWLEGHRCLPPDVVVIAFDWPSQRIYRNQIHDINEKGRRAFVAAYHLARFVQQFPPSSRICLLGQSYGGRVVPGALHLLGGGSLNSQSRDPQVGLPAARPDLQLHGVIIAGASDRTWLDPGQRFDKALSAATGFLNLFNRRDESLILYPLLVRSNHHRALGRLGLSNRDYEKLGLTAERYEEHDIHDILHAEHSLLDAVASPKVGRWIAPYIWAVDPGPIFQQSNTAPSPYGGGVSGPQERRREVERGVDRN